MKTLVARAQRLFDRKLVEIAQCNQRCHVNPSKLISLHTRYLDSPDLLQPNCKLLIISSHNLVPVEEVAWEAVQDDPEETSFRFDSRLFIALDSAINLGWQLHDIQKSIEAFTQVWSSKRQCKVNMTSRSNLCIVKGLLGRPSQTFTVPSFTFYKRRPFGNEPFAHVCIHDNCLATSWTTGGSALCESLTCLLSDVATRVVVWLGKRSFKVIWKQRVRMNTFRVFQYPAGEEFKVYYMNSAGMIDLHQVLSLIHAVASIPNPAAVESFWTSGGHKESYVPELPSEEEVKNELVDQQGTIKLIFQSISSSSLSFEVYQNMKSQSA